MTTKETLDAPSRTLRELDLLLRRAPGVRSESLPVAEVLEREAQMLLVAHREGQLAVATLLRGERFRAGKSKRTDEELLSAALTVKEARAAIARWHGFTSFSEGRKVARPVEPLFEAACDAVVDGDEEALASLLTREPALVKERSPFPHHATLLQHVAANGIESTRQWQSPANAAAIARRLLDAGAEPDAACDCYGGGWTAMTLLVTSAHPAAAGVQAQLVEVLCNGGASPNGPEDDGAPLWWAIAFCYTDAADQLVRCGARADNLFLAAAIGDLEAVKGCFGKDGRCKPDRADCWGRSLAPSRRLDVKHMLEYALIYAAAHGRREMVELLLTKQPDLSIKEPLWKNDALDGARYGKHPEVVALLQPLFPT